ncbi:MAG: PD-(D/E)XK nuclease family protein [Chitinophagales bacterium]
MSAKFLSKVAQHVSSKGTAGGVLVLFPTRRACTYFRDELKRNNAEGIDSVMIKTLEDWLIGNSKLQLIEPLEQLLTLYDLYKEKGGEETAEEFFGMGEVMLSDFNEVDLQLANAKSFFNYLEQLQSMKVYVPGEDELSEYSVRYQKFWQTFKELYTALREKLKANNKAYLGMVYRAVAENLSLLSKLPKNIYIAGFSNLTKSEEKIINHLVLEGAEVLWDYDSYYADDTFQEAGVAFRKYERTHRVNKEEWLSHALNTAPKQVNIIGVAKNVGQTKVAADILVNRLKLTPEEEKDTAIIVLDNKLLNPLINAVSPYVSAMNVSMGLPLNNTPFAELLKIVFSLQENAERFSKNDNLRFYHRDVFDMLQHAYTEFLLPDKKPVADFISRMKRFNRMVISRKELVQAFGEELSGLLFWNTNVVDEYLANVNALIEKFKSVFTAKEEPEAAEFAEDLEWLSYFKEIGDKIGAAVKGGEQITVQAMRKLLIEHIRWQVVPFEGEPVRGLQLMGILESRAIDFKNVIILSMNEGIFPASKTQPTYIPYEMRKEFLSTHLERDATAAYLFYRLMQRAENVYLLYNTEPDELGGGEKSRFILQLQHEWKEKNAAVDIKEYVYSVDPPVALADDLIGIEKTPELLQPMVNNLADYGISPSAINTYINCSLQYYFKYVAKLREQDDIEESMEASTLGSAVHHVLENIYADVKGKALDIAFVEEAARNKKRIDDLLREFFKGRFDDESLRKGKNYLLYRVCGKLIDEFFKQEKRTLALLEDSGMNMLIDMLENEMAHTVEVNGVHLKIKGKVDRVERVGEVIHVADYKTGSAIGSKIETEDMLGLADDPKFAKAMQLLCYAWLYWKGNSTDSTSLQIRSGIYWLRDSAKGFDTLKIGSSDALGPEVILQFEETLKKVLGDLVNPQLPFTKTIHVERCVNCEFVRICRRN